MSTKNSFLISSTANLFLLVFIFFVLLIYIEDIYIFRILEKTNEIMPLIYIGRIFIALSFSIFISILSFLYIMGFLSRLKKLELITLEFAREKNEETLLNTFLRYNELERLKNTIYDLLEKYHLNELYNRNNSNVIFKNEIINKIIPNIFEIKLSPIKNLDISILPNKSPTVFFDFIDVIETVEGCIVCMTGNENDDIDSALFKFKVKNAINFFKTYGTTLEENLFNNIFSYIRESLESKVNISLLYISKKSDKLIYHSFQRNPIFYIREKKILKLLNYNENYIESKNSIYNPFNIEFIYNDYILLISDRIEKLKEFSDDKYVDFIHEKLNNFESKKNSSKELLVYFINLLEIWQKQTIASGNIYDYLACIAIRKK